MISDIINHMNQYIAMLQKGIGAGWQGGDQQAALQSLAGILSAVDTFYNSIGGLIGYQLKCLQILQADASHTAAAVG